MTFNVHAFVPAPSYTGLPIGYGDGTQDAGPGEFAFIPDIVAADYAPLTANKAATPATISAVLDGLLDGDVVTLEDGNYTSISLADLDITATIQAENLHGAVFSGGIAIDTCTDIRVVGIKAGSASWLDCDNSICSYLYLDGALSCTRSDTTSTTGNINWFKCLADLGWPSPATKDVAGFVRQVAGSFAGAVTEGAQDHTIKSCIFMRSTEDNFKGTWFRSVGIIDCLFWGCRVDEDEGSTGDFHPDAIQLSSQGADSSHQCQDVWIIGCAFVNTTLSGLDEGQGLWMKDGLFARFTVVNCILTSGLNSISLGCHDAHTGTVIDRCSSTQNIRISGNTNTVRGCIYGINNTSDGVTVPVYIDNYTFNYDLPEINAYEYGRPAGIWELRSFLPQSETVWNNQGASELLYRCHLRMVAEGLTGFVPSGWSA